MLLLTAYNVLRSCSKRKYAGGAGRSLIVFQNILFFFVTDYTKILFLLIVYFVVAIIQIQSTTKFQKRCMHNIGCMMKFDL